MYKKDVYDYLEEHKGHETMLYIDDPHDKCGGMYFAFCEGTGDNLLHEDIEQGFVDYIDYCTFRLALDDHYEPAFVEDDGGMILLEKMYSEMTGKEIFNVIKDMIIIPEDAEVTVLT